MTTDGPEYCVKNRSKTKISMFLSFWQFLIKHVAELVEDNLQAEHLFLLTYGRSKKEKSKNVYIIICNTRDISLVYITKGLFLK